MQITRNTLLPALQYVKGALEKKSTIPVLSHILLVGDKNQLTIAASDLDITKRAGAVATDSGGISLAIPGKKFIEIISAIQAEEITLKQKETSLTITAGTSRFTVSGTKTEDFPQIEYPTQHLFDLSAEAIETIVGRTVTATTDESSRFALQGVLIEAVGNTLKATATNGHYLVHAQHPIPSVSPFRFIVPRKACAELTAMAQRSETIAVGCDDLEKPTLVKFTNNRNEEITSRLITGEFPNYEMVIPKGDLISIQISLSDLQAAVKRVILMADERSHCVTIVFSQDTATLEAASSDVGTVSETLDTKFSGDPFKIGMNGQYLQTALSQMEQESLNFELKDAISQFLLREKVGETQFWQVIMPMRVS